METNNNAMLREVVKELLDAMYDMGIDEETVSIAIESPNCHMHSAELLSVIKKAKAALAAPPRNCDRYEDAPSAYADFIVPWKLDGHLDDVPTLQDFANWLFAPATEQKGDDDEQK